MINLSTSSRIFLRGSGSAGASAGKTPGDVRNATRKRNKIIFTRYHSFKTNIQNSQ